MKESEVTDPGELPKPSAADILRSWGELAESNIDFTAVMLRDSVDVSDLRKRIVAKNLSSSVEQYLIPLFRHIYSQVRQEVLNSLRGFNYSEQMIDDYFLNFGNSPSMKFSFVYGPADRTEFKNKAYDFMLIKLKEYLF